LVTTRQVDDALAEVALSMYQLSETAPRRYRLDAIPEGAACEWSNAARDALQELLHPEHLVINEVADVPMDDSQKFRFTRPMPRPQVMQ
jgi:hypothetical protein